MPWIHNASFGDIVKGQHPSPTWRRTMLIQIVDPDMGFPTPTCEFAERHFFKFLDIEDGDSNAERCGMSADEAVRMVGLLKHALAEEMNVIVHCVAGVCRSGAVVEVGIIMGFDEPEDVYRCPNLRVKRLMMQELGLTYNEEDRVLRLDPESGLLLPTGIRSDPTAA